MSCKMTPPFYVYDTSPKMTYSYVPRRIPHLFRIETLKLQSEKCQHIRASKRSYSRCSQNVIIGPYSRQPGGNLDIFFLESDTEKQKPHTGGYSSISDEASGYKAVISQAK